MMAVFGVISVTANGGYYGMMGTGSWEWGMAMMAVPIAILMIVLMAALRGLADHPYPIANPMEVLDQRYARGELNRDEYLTIRSDLAGRQ